ncbi:UNVERIFIED_ORG: hypothetical protein ABID57_001323 [Arthrobacter sp. UYEF1]
MGKLGGIILLSALALSGCASAPAVIEPASQVQQLPASVQSEMLSELRPLLKTLKSSDGELIQKAFIACGNLAFRDKDAYREAVLAQYPEDLSLGLDHLTVAAAGKQYLCP